MDVVDIILRVCLWGSVALIPILLFWAVFGGRRSGSGKRRRPKPQPPRKRGFIPPPAPSGKPEREHSKSTPSEEAVSPQPAAPKPAGDPKPRPMSGRGLIPHPPRYAEAGSEDSGSTTGKEAATPQPDASRPPVGPKLKPASGEGAILPPVTSGRPVPNESESATGEDSASPKPDPSRRLVDPTAQIEFISKVDFEPRPLLNKSEYRILRILEEVSRDIPGGHRIMAQTSLGEVLAPQPASGSKEERDLAFGSINSKRLDFLVIDAYGLPVLAVEYHGHGHYAEKAFMRDAVKREVLRKAGIRFLEIPAEYDDKDLERDLRKALLSNPTRRP